MKSLSGTWFSELGSRLEIIVKNDGLIEGMYYSAVGGTQGAFRITGMVDNLALNGSRCFGLVVSWNNDHVNQHSVTVWSGQYQVIDSEEVLTATWLLTRETDPTNDWTSTLVGSDTFHRAPPTSTKLKRTQRPEPMLSK
ncbi:MAG: avidin/streptavidin family protein [Anaerolineae bacterium]